MSVILEYGFRSDGLVLSPTLSTVDVRVDIDGVAASEPTHPQLFVWVDGDIEGFDAALHGDPTVSDPTVLSDHGDRRLYRVTTTDAVETVLYPLWVELGGEGLEAHFEDGWWHSQLRFPDHHAVSTYRDVLTANGVEFRLEAIYDGSDGPSEPDLTIEQRETLVLAYRRGYFTIPREVTTADLADELGVSDQAVSERLRRAFAHLVATQLEVDPLE